MGIIIARYKIVDGMAMIPTVKILEKHPDTHDFGFEINDKLSWFKYLSRKYGKESEDKNGIPYAFRVYNWNGHTPINFFPGTKSSDGTPLNLAKYGRLVDKVEHKKYLVKC